MKRVGMQASEGLELTGMGGLVLVGAVLKRFTSFQAAFNGAFSKGPGGIPFGDVRCSPWSDNSEGRIS